MPGTPELRPLGEALGTEALGVDLSKLDDATFAWIREAGLPANDVEQILERTAPAVLGLAG